jgi:hypothetical protein
LALRKANSSRVVIFYYVHNSFRQASREIIRYPVLGRVSSLFRVHPSMVFSSNLCVMRTLSSSGYQLYACGKICACLDLERKSSFLDGHCFSDGCIIKILAFSPDLIFLSCFCLIRKLSFKIMQVKHGSMKDRGKGAAAHNPFRFYFSRLTQ